MSLYLRDAANLVRRAADAAERKHSKYPNVQELVSSHMVCARMFAMLAAIDKGLLPHELAGDINGHLATKDAGPTDPASPVDAAADPAADWTNTERAGGAR
jgi:hypothetical protein